MYLGRLCCRGGSDQQQMAISSSVRGESEVIHELWTLWGVATSVPMLGGPLYFANGLMGLATQGPQVRTVAGPSAVTMPGEGILGVRQTTVLSASMTSPFFRNQLWSPRKLTWRKNMLKETCSGEKGQVFLRKDYPHE